MNKGKLLSFLKDKSNNNATWLMLDKLIRMSLNILVFLYFARAVGAEEFGQYNFIMSLVLIMQGISTLGTMGITTRELVKYPDKRNELIGTTLAIVFFMSLVSYISIILFGFIYNDSGPIIYYFVIGLLVVFQSLEVIDLYFQAEKRIREISRIRIKNTLLFVIFKIVILTITESLLIISCVFIFEYIVMYMKYLITYRKINGRLRALKFRLNIAKRLLAESWPLAISILGSVIYLRIDQVMVQFIAGNSAVGNYALASKISEMWIFIPQAIAVAYFPKIIQSQNDKRKFNYNMQQLYTVIFGLSIIIIPIILLGSSVIPLILGEEYREAKSILQIHVFGLIFSFWGAIRSKWFIAEGLLKLSLLSHLGGAILNIIFNLFLIPLYGGVGAATATVISYCFSYYILNLFFKDTQIAFKMMSKSPYKLVELLSKKVLKN
ncbi:flippase [Halobacillus litoralis]|uniref:flippase n=1 Tax=Halobacillus litoralis TaxID=45668 RepID=UPI001CFF40FE|nr:flippase [Halobacillus litoralis]